MGQWMDSQSWEAFRWFREQLHRAPLGSKSFSSCPRMDHRFAKRPDYTPKTTCKTRVGPHTTSLISHRVLETSLESITLSEAGSPLECRDRQGDDTDEKQTERVFPPYQTGIQVSESRTEDNGRVSHHHPPQEAVLKPVVDSHHEPNQACADEEPRNVARCER